MRTSQVASPCLLAALLVATFARGAAASAPPDSTAHATTARAARHAARAHAKAAAKRASPPAASPKAESRTAAPRTLQDIHIEGEIPVPQVLFVTTRDQRRFVDFRTQRYLKTSQQVGEETVFPSRIVVTESRPADEPKENAP